MHRKTFSNELILSLLSVLAVLLLVPAPLLAQDVGMGQREGTGRRFEEPYTLQIETPHVVWAKPMPGGPIRLLAVPSVQEGRTLVELAERFELDLTTVSIDPAWDINKWTMAFGKDYGARAEQGDLNLIYGYLEQELTSDKQFDVILLPLHHGWEALSPRSRQALIDRVKEGCGLVLIRPFESELSPLVPAVPVKVPPQPYEPMEPEFESSSWSTVEDHYLTRAIPIESFPFDLLEDYKYRLAPDSKALVITGSGSPVLATRKFGKGTVVAFGFRNIGLSWRMPMRALGQPVDVYWEYFYAMLGRSIMYAAGREPEPVARQRWERWLLRSEKGVIVSEGTGPADSFGDLPPGRYFLEQHGSADWEISAINISQPNSARIESIEPRVMHAGESVKVRFDATGPAEITVEDGFGRLLGRAKTDQAGSRQATLPLKSPPLTHGGFLRVRVGTAEVTEQVRFAAFSREWNDYEVILPWYGPNSYQPWIPALDAQLRKIGVTTLEDPERNFRIIASVHEPVFGIYWYNRESYVERKARFLETGDTSFVTRNISLHAPNLERDMRDRFEERVGDMVPLEPFAYYLADESSVTCYADAFDVDWSSADLTAFRAWLKTRYGTVANLNENWSTRFESWDQVLPMTTKQAQEHGNFAPWSDHRVFMEEAFVQRIRDAGKLAHEIDPGARASFSGTQIPTPHNGCNWYEIDQIADYLQPYSGGNQDAMHYLFNPNLRLTGFTGYGRTHDVQQEVWRRLFYGHSGASIFWHYTLMNPDLTLSEQGEGLSRAFGKMQSGVGRIFMNSGVAEDGVAIHFSMASIRGAWITDGTIEEGVASAQRTSQNFRELMQRRNLWVKELEKQGVQFRFLASPQIEAGDLRNYKVLILPYSIALSDKEVTEIEEFAASGGMVYIDEQTGRMNEKCRWRTKQLWQDPPAGFRNSGPTDLGIPRALGISGDHLTTVRNFGTSKLIGLLPESATTLTLPSTDRVRYDLWTQGTFGPTIEIDPSRPALILERPSRIDSLQISDNLELRLKDEAGQPVDRSVIQVEVISPSGQPIPYYSKNVDLVNGVGHLEIPFALNDSPGTWTIRATDAISGIRAERLLNR